MKKALSFLILFSGFISFASSEYDGSRTVPVHRIPLLDEEGSPIVPMTADATNRTGHSGPAEATAIGNCLVQMIAMGDLPDLHAGRDLVRTSFEDEIHRYDPANRDAWQSAHYRWKQLTNR